MNANVYGEEVFLRSYPINKKDTFPINDGKL